MICEQCNLELVVGSWPWCPHGTPGQVNAIQTNESFIGGVTIENMSHEPVTVFSREEFKQAMLSRGLEQRIKYVPGDKHLQDWSKCIDANTLENARILIERQQLHGKGTAPDPSVLPSLRAEWLDVGPAE